jgi:hypothetical protein
MEKFNHLTGGDSSMLGYQFYCLDENGKDHLIGVLPERRFNPGRITDRSIMNWARGIIGNGCHGRRIHFVRVNMPEGDQEIH